MLFALIGGGIVVAGGLILLLVPQSRVLLKGMTNVIFEDMASTPEGARAVYSEAIQEAKDDYTEADNTYQQISGQVERLKKEIARNDSELKKNKANINSLAKANDWDAVELLSDQIDILEEQRAANAEMLKEYAEMEGDAKEARDNFEAEVKRLERDKDKHIRSLELNKQRSEMYDQMDELKNSSHAREALHNVRKGVEKADVKAAGAKKAYESKTSTRLNRANEKARKASSSDRVAELRSKYGK